MTDAADTLPQRFNMAAYAIGRAARARPKHPALIVMDAPGAPPAEVWTFADLEDAVLRIAGGLKAAGIPAGARILLRLENTSAYALTFFGAIAGGFVPLPTSAQLTDREVQFLLDDSGAEAVVHGGNLGSECRAARRHAIGCRRHRPHATRGPASGLRRHQR